MQLIIELSEGKNLVLHERHVTTEEMQRITNWFENETTPVIKFNNNSTGTTNYIARQAISCIIEG